MGTCLPAPQGRRSGQRSVLVQSCRQARLPRPTGDRMAQHRDRLAGIDQPFGSCDCASASPSACVPFAPDRRLKCVPRSSIGACWTTEHLIKTGWFIQQMKSGWFSRQEIVAIAANLTPTSIVISTTATPLPVTAPRALQPNASSFTPIPVSTRTCSTPASPMSRSRVPATRSPGPL